MATCFFYFYFLDDLFVIQGLYRDITDLVNTSDYNISLVFSYVRYQCLPTRITDPV